MKEYKLFTVTKVGSKSLLNHIVMTPLTRCRAVGNIPNALMTKYYEQRSQAGLIITDGTSPSPNGLGYARIPGIFNAQQISGWKRVTDAAHGNSGKIFVQLMHCGRIVHLINLPAGATLLAPSAINAAGQIWTDAKLLQDYTVPKEMTKEDIATTKSEYVLAAKNIMEAGFDGVELHSGKGYLLEQFLSPAATIKKIIMVEASGTGAVLSQRLQQPLLMR